MNFLLGSNDLPDGLPRNWPYSSEEDLAECPNRIVDVGKTEQGRWFCNNSVKTSKYEIYNFLPMFLMEEFNPKSKLANCYFLIICALQCIPQISNTAGVPTTLIPLTFIVLIDGIFCALEDYVRHKADTLANSSKTLKLIPQSEDHEAHFKTVLWSDVKVGDILRVRNRETVPCDVVLIDAAPTVGVSEGVCFVETKSIDGETNLKSRNSLNFNRNVLLKSKKQPIWYNKLKGQIEMEHPNNLVDSFSGVFSQYILKKIEEDFPTASTQKTITEHLISDDGESHALGDSAVGTSKSHGSSLNGADEKSKHRDSLTNGTHQVEIEKYPILLNNVLLRGCIVRNNDWVVGIAVSTGHDSKIMMTSLSSLAKLSSVEIETSRIIKHIIVFLVSLGLFASFGQIIWDDEYMNKIDYLDWNIDSPSEILVQWVLANFYYLLIHSSIIPVSLYVSMTFARFIQSYFMMNDLDMYNSLKQPPNPDETAAIIRTMTLNEELGQVSHIFSDKTGTLTSNIMEFRKMSINGVMYGIGITDIGRAAWKLLDKEVPADVLEGEEIAKKNAVPNVVFYCNKYNEDLQNETIRQYAKTYDKLDLSIPKNKSIYDAVVHAARMKEFFFCLAVCHDAIREDDSVKKESDDEEDGDEDGNSSSRPLVGTEDSIDSNYKAELHKKRKTVKLSASNPDDQALISAAEFFGYTFAKRLKNQEILILERTRKTIDFKGVNPNSSFVNNQRAHISSPLSSSSSLVGSGDALGTNKGFETVESPGDSSTPNSIGMLKIKHSNNDSDSNSNSNSNSNDHNDNSGSSYDDFTEKKVKLLQTIAFSSKRKRMSVIIDSNESHYTLYCKGAETVIYERMSKTENVPSMVSTIDSQLQQYGHEGMRCLLVSKRNISKQLYDAWAKKYADACSNLEQIDLKKNGKSNLIEKLENEIETELILLGITAIEDRLQDGVPHCIEALLNAGINVWVLTGDKEETAINIAIACNLIAAKDEFMRRIVINKTVCPTIQDACDLMTSEIELIEEEAKIGTPKPRSLVVDGPSLVSILHPELRTGSKSNFSFRSYKDIKDMFRKSTPSNSNSRMSSRSSPSLLKPHTSSVSPADSDSPSSESLFVTLAMKCKAVVGCRVSPDQKREVVSVVRHAYPDITTLGVGDGANDVAMIKEVHIGVGIKGEEGVQAVNASDYAITQFRFLKPLVIKHGRFNYIRLTRLICYVFYKNVFMTLGIFLFNFFCGFSGQKPFSETGIQLFNLIYTSLPIIMFSGYDMDLEVATVYAYPKTYEVGVKKQYFNKKVVAFCILNAVVDSVLVVIIGYFVYRNNGGFSVLNVGGDNNDPTFLKYTGSRGMVGSFWDIGICIFTAIEIITNIKIVYFQCNWTWVHVLVNIFSMSSWFAVFYGISYWKDLDFECYLTWNRIMGDGVFWLVLLLMVTLITLKDFIILVVKKEFFPSIVDQLQLKQCEDKKGLNSVKPAI